MKIIFNDGTELTVQSVSVEDGHLLIKTVSATLDELRAKFSDAFATKRMEVQERGQTVTVYEYYTTLHHLEVYTGKIYGAAMYLADKTPEAQAEMVNAAVLVAQIQAQTLSDEEALTVQSIYPAWNGEGVQYQPDYKVRFGDALYKCLQAHTSQADWAPDVAPSLWAKVLISEDGTILEWEQPDSTNGYSTGDKVTHDGKTWESLVDNTVWEPGAAGTESLWKEV